MLRSQIVVVLAALLASVSAGAQRPAGLAPTEQVWTPAPTPVGGTSWKTLESTKEVQRLQSGMIYSKPAFPPQIKALNGKRVKVSGYVMPLETSARQAHFVLLGYPPDCPFHLNPAPTQFLEVRVTSPISVDNRVRTIEGTMVLGGTDESGIFYKLVNAREI